MSVAGPNPASLMNGGHSNVALAPSAETVGNQFVSQFYLVLHSSPRYLHRFYTDQSSVTYTDASPESGQQTAKYTAYGQKDINDIIMKMGFEESRTEIWSVESQYSMGNGVVVLVTGSIECKGRKRRDFVQSFFLAPQERGYYVLNDAFAFLRNQNNPASSEAHNAYQPTPHNVQANSYTQQNGDQLYANYRPTPSQTNPSNSAYSTQASYQAPSAPQNSQPHQTVNTQAPTTQYPQPTQTPAAPQSAVQPSSQPQAKDGQGSTPPAQKSPVAEAPSPVQEPPKASPPTNAEKASEPAAQPKPIQKPEPAKESAPKSQPAPQPPKQTSPEPSAPSKPLSYADRLKLGAKAPTTVSKPATQAPVAQQPVKAIELVPTPKPKEDVEAISTAQELENGIASHTEGASVREDDISYATSIFVRNVPEDITVEKLDEVFSQYGKIKGGTQGIEVKLAKNRPSFVFIEYEDASSAQAAYGDVTIDGRKVQVTQRKPLQKNRFDRGGRGEGRGYRGGPGRGDRGRGNRDGRPATGNRENRPEGRGEGGGRGRGYGRDFAGEGRGRGENGRGRGRGDRANVQKPAQTIPIRPVSQQA